MSKRSVLDTKCGSVIPHGGSSAEKPWYCIGLYDGKAVAAAKKIKSVERPWTNIGPCGNRSADVAMKRRTMLDMWSDSEVPHGSSNAAKRWIERLTRVEVR